MKEVARVLYGSQNYNLDNAQSDKDYKVLLCPSWDDLYRMKKVSKSDATGDSEHNSPMDCRQFNTLLLRGNTNVLEMVYSTEWHYNEDMQQYIMHAKDLLSYGYLALVWPDFYAATQGMALNSLQRYGANPKAVSRSWYLYQLAQYVHDHDFAMFTNCWRNEDYAAKARELRFGPNMPSAEEYQRMADLVLDNFTDNKASFAADAKLWMGAHPERVERLKARAELLTAEMKDLVLHELMEELDLV